MPAKDALIRCFVNGSSKVLGCGEQDATSLDVVCRMEPHLRFFAGLRCLSPLLAVGQADWVAARPPPTPFARGRTSIYGMDPRETRLGFGEPPQANSCKTSEGVQARSGGVESTSIYQNIIRLLLYHPQPAPQTPFRNVSDPTCVHVLIRKSLQCLNCVYL
jgi:hypothetical protein